MRYFIVILLVAFIAADVCNAQHGYHNNHHSSSGCEERGCAVPQYQHHHAPRHMHHQQQCGCQECRARHIYLCLQQQNGGVPESGIDDDGGNGAPQGAFVAPPRSGTTYDGNNGFGIRGLAITVPRLRLELPSIELPSLMSYRTSERMRLEETDAPYVLNSNLNARANQALGYYNAVNPYAAFARQPGAGGTPESGVDTPGDRATKESGADPAESLDDYYQDLLKREEELRVKCEQMARDYERLHQIMQQLQHMQQGRPCQHSNQVDPNCTPNAPELIPTPNHHGYYVPQPANHFQAPTIERFPEVRTASYRTNSYENTQRR